MRPPGPLANLDAEVGGARGCEFFPWTGIFPRLICGSLPIRCGCQDE